MQMNRFALPEYGSPIKFTLTLKKATFILIANTAIALFIFLVHTEGRFLESLILSQCIGISIALAVFTTIHIIRTPKLVHQVAFITIAVIAGSIIGMTVGAIVVNLAMHGILPPKLLGSGWQDYRSSLLYSGLFGSVISYLFLSLQRISDEQVQRLEAEKNAVVTELRLLQAQMEPHFLFNTISNIISLVEGEPEKARRMLESFAALLRVSFETALEKTIPLSQEMDIIKHYLEIYSMRMGDRLCYTIQLPEGLRAVPVPSLLIQPLVENAIRHGLEPSIKGGELSIRGELENGVVSITVADTGRGMNEESGRKGVGLDNIRRRLLLLYGSGTRLTLYKNKPTGIKAVIEIPYETNNSSHRG